MVGIGKYSDFVKNPKALAKLQAWLDLDKFLDKASEVQDQVASHNRALCEGELDCIFRKSI